MRTTFFLFPKLPAELRITIYGFALQDEYDLLDFCPARKIKFHEFDPSTGSISIKMSQPYPKLLAVNRETRCETAKLCKYDWMTILATPRRLDGTSGTPRFELAINFNKDHILILKGFLAQDPHFSIWRNETDSIEHFRLKMFTQLFPPSTLNRIKQISVQVLRPPKELRIEGNARWRGQGLELFHPGALERVILVSLNETHQIAHAFVQSYLERHWMENGGRIQPPVVESVRNGFMENWRYMTENLVHRGRSPGVTNRVLTADC